MLDRRHVVAGVAALFAAVPGRARAQQKYEVTTSRQPGILYLPTHVIEKQSLLEKHAERLGLAGLAVKWVAFNNGGAQQDALISGNVDLINTGTGQLLLMWDKLKGGVKAVVATSAAPLTFISRDPKISSLWDLAEGDKIAVPTIRISTQSILLQIAAADKLGPDKWNHFDPLTIQMGHPDAFIAMKNPAHEIRNHFAAPPFQFYELQSVMGAHVVTTSTEILGTPLSQGQFMTTTRFAAANPKIIDALRAAAEEAKAFIETKTESAVEIYKEINNDKTPTDRLLALLAQPGMMEWSLNPQGTMKFASHLHRIGALKNLPTSWTDYYLSIAHDLPGN